MKFENVYFINGTAYAGKSTMVKLLAEKYDGIACEENYQDRLLENLDTKEFPNLTYTRDLQDWGEFVRRTPDEYEAWVNGVTKECTVLEIEILKDLVSRTKKKIFVDTNISVEILHEISDENHVLIMLADPNISVQRFFERPDKEKQFLYQLLLKEDNPEDKDLAEIYGYEVKRLNEQVKRNISRFPEDFMFQLNREEIPEGFSKSQFATLNEKSNRQGSNIKKMPFAFTEQGIYMLATVLRGELAEQQSIFIMRTFREMRHYIKQNQQFVTRSEMELLSSKVTEISVQTTGLIDKQKQTDQKVNLIQKNVEQLSENFISEKDVKNFVIYKGQKLEADIAYIEIYQQAKKSIYVVDDYMNAKSLQHLSQKADGVEVVLFTENGKGGRGFLTNSLVTDFQNEYPTIRIKPNPDCHDRLIILDYGEKTELVYHCGASSKDAGKKLCAINQITETAIIHPVIDRLLTLPDKQI